MRTRCALGLARSSGSPLGLRGGRAPDRYLAAAGEAAPVPGPVLGTLGLLGSSLGPGPHLALCGAPAGHSVMPVRAVVPWGC